MSVLEYSKAQNTIYRAAILYGRSKGEVYYVIGYVFLSDCAETCYGHVLG